LLSIISRGRGDAAQRIAHDAEAAYVCAQVETDLELAGIDAEIGHAPVELEELVVERNSRVRWHRP
jgi:hypothetical protein